MPGAKNEIAIRGGRASGSGFGCRLLAWVPISILTRSRIPLIRFIKPVRFCFVQLLRDSAQAITELPPLILIWWSLASTTVFLAIKSANVCEMVLSQATVTVSPPVIAARRLDSAQSVTTPAPRALPDGRNNKAAHTVT